MGFFSPWKFCHTGNVAKIIIRQFWCKHYRGLCKINDKILATVAIASFEDFAIYNITRSWTKLSNISSMPDSYLVNKL